MPLYEIVPFDRLKAANWYKVNGPAENVYSFGRCCRKEDKVARFEKVEVYESNTKVYTVTPEWFDQRCTFMREVFKTEQRRVCRAAFEKRAVNQIVAAIVGHKGEYY